MKRSVIALLAALTLAAPAAADVVIQTTPGTASYTGPTAFTPTTTFDFEAATPRWSGGIFTDNVGSVRAQPFGSTGGYASSGPTDGSPNTFDLTNLGVLRYVSFIWGSVDSYNTLEVLGVGGSVLKTIVGSDIFVPADGNQTSPNTNPLVTLAFTGDTYGKVTGLRFASTQNAFEIDNLAVGVPEPASWALMLGGFGLVGAAIRRRSRPANRVVYA